MAREFGRAERVGDFLKRELAGLIQHKLRDPRLGLVSVNEVKVSRDIGFADVYVTFMEATDEADALISLKVLNNAAGFLRTQIAKDIQMRTTPKIRFKYDESVNRGRHLSDLIDRATSADRKLSDASED